MPRLNLSEFLKKEDVKAGDLVMFVDEGKEVAVDFKSGQGEQTVFQITVELPDGTVKVWTPNKTSLKSLVAGYGVNTEEWVGKRGVVEFRTMNCFGKTQDVVILNPVKD